MNVFIKMAHIHYIDFMGDFQRTLDDNVQIHFVDDKTQFETHGNTGFLYRKEKR